MVLLLWLPVGFVLCVGKLDGWDKEKTEESGGVAVAKKNEEEARGQLRQFYGERRRGCSLLLSV